MMVCTTDEATVSNDGFYLTLTTTFNDGLYSLPNDNILGRSKMEALADEF